MTITISRFVLEFTRSHLFVRFPGIGEGYIGEMGAFWDSWEKCQP